MSNMIRSRAGPLLLAAGVFGGILYMTYGGKQQPRPRATADASSQMPVSETLQGAAHTGGGTAARGEQEREALRQYDPRDTRLMSSSPDAQSKRNPQKARGGDLGGDDTSPGGGALGKHMGEREPGKEGGDLPWKKVGS